MNPNTSTDSPGRRGRRAWIVFAVLDALVVFFGSSFVLFPSADVRAHHGTDGVLHLNRYLWGGFLIVSAVVMLAIALPAYRRREPWAWKAAWYNVALFVIAAAVEGNPLAAIMAAVLTSANLRSRPRFTNSDLAEPGRSRGSALRSRTGRTSSALVLLLAAACGGSSPGNLNAYCSTARELDSQNGPPTEAQLRKLRADAPEPIRDTVKKTVEKILPAVKNGDPSVFQRADVAALIDKINSFEANKCGIKHAGAQGSNAKPGAQPVAVSAVDFKFEGVPTTAPAGDYAVTLKNTGAQPHEMVFVELKPGVTMDQVISTAKDKGEGAAKQLLTNDNVASSSGPAAPGASTTFGVTLEKGKTYGYVCFVGGPPHAFQGMYGQLSAQ